MIPQPIHLSIGDTATIVVNARDFYAGTPVIQVETGEMYTFDCAAGQRWIDWYISSSPAGYVNPLLWLSGRRLKGTKCFCLCGAIGPSEDHLFEIGIHLEGFEMPASGSLFFFANDFKWAYWNNRGSVTVTVQRIG